MAKWCLYVHTASALQGYADRWKNNNQKEENMSTVIYPSPIFGPVKSRRLGISLGINLMPADGKVCTFDCVYCECGFNAERRPALRRPARCEVSDALEQTLKSMGEAGELPDVLTFAGNGEPTAHPLFADIIADTLRLRDKYCPKAKVSVLSNATMLGREDVFKALLSVDNNIQKLDTVSAEYINSIDRPQSSSYNVDEVVEQLKAFGGKVIIQTLFMRGEADGVPADNTGEEYVEPWLKALRYIAPSEVMVYTIDRETPAKGLLKASPEELDAICARVQALGIKCSASY